MKEKHLPDLEATAETLPAMTETLEVKPHGSESLPAGDTMKSPRVGRFESPGEYMKDFCVIKQGDIHHLFYNVGSADEKQCWTSAGNEESFGPRHFAGFPDVAAS